MIPSYLINLDRDQERLAFVLAHFQQQGINPERFAAVDGRQYSELEYQRFIDQRPRQGKKSWLRGQMGCFLSHYGVWQRIVNSRVRFAAVFEDDIHIAPGLYELLDGDNWIPDSIDIIRLDTSTNRVRLGPEPALQCHSHCFYRLLSTSWCTGGYIIHQRTARQLLDLAPRYHQPSDVLLFNHEESAIARQLKVLQASPALCVQDKHHRGAVTFSSNIEAGATRDWRLYCRQCLQGGYRYLAGYKRVEFKG